MTYLYSILSIICGVALTLFTYKTRKEERPSLTVGYIMHLRGYLGGIGFIILGILLVLC
jgi:hypothetical protein